MVLSADAAPSIHRTAEFSIVLGKRHQSKGYGKEAVGWFVDQGFRACNLHRIECGVLGYNVAAIKLYESLGFSVEGRQRDKFWMQGQWVDRIQMCVHS
ncbi:acyl-CoA N-acyltransferase, partial [Atractiella rhizophila]